MKKWNIRNTFVKESEQKEEEHILSILLGNRGITGNNDVAGFLNPPDPRSLTAMDVGIDTTELTRALKRIRTAIDNKESIVVYADYDADGITAGAVMWETLWKLGARVMPYIPDRKGEGYGLSRPGIDAVQDQFDPSLIITVDHGISARDNIAYAATLGIDVIVTDHHTKPEHPPECIVVHTTALSGSGVSWFVTKELLRAADKQNENAGDTVGLAAMGTIADLVPLTGPNRAIVKAGLEQLRKTGRFGFTALLADAGITGEALDTYSVSHMLAPRINAMGRIDHALDALRLLCTTDPVKAKVLARKLGLTNTERQKMTEESVQHALGLMPKEPEVIKKLIFIAHESYNQGIIGLVAGKLTERHYRPSVVLSIGDGVAKASARSIPGFNIIDAIRTCGDLLVDAGGHPMAAGFTVSTENLHLLEERLVAFAENTITDDMLVRSLDIDLGIPLWHMSESLWRAIRDMAPFGVGNPQPVFASVGLTVSDARIIGSNRTHVKFRVKGEGMRSTIDAIAFTMADRYGDLVSGSPIDAAYTLDMNEWNGKRSLQLKVRDLKISGT